MRDGHPVRAGEPFSSEVLTPRRLCSARLETETVAALAQDRTVIGSFFKQKLKKTSGAADCPNLTSFAD
jgi:hypothetical protein